MESSWRKKIRTNVFIWLPFWAVSPGSLDCSTKTSLLLTMVVHAFKPRTLETEASRSLWGIDKPGLYIASSRPTRATEWDSVSEDGVKFYWGTLDAELCLHTHLCTSTLTHKCNVQIPYKGKKHFTLGCLLYWSWLCLQYELGLGPLECEATALPISYNPSLYIDFHKLFWQCKSIWEPKAWLRG